MLPTSPELILALRATRRTPLLTLVAAVSIAIGIGLATAAFTVVRDTTLGRLPVPHGDRIVALRDVDRAGGWDVPVEHAEFTRRRAALRSFDDVAGYRTRRPLVEPAGGEPGGGTVANAAFVTMNAFSVLEVQPVVGRGFDSGDAVGGDAIVVSDAFARTLAGAPQAALGRRLVIEGQSRTVVGVMPRGFRFPFDHDLWLPLPLAPAGPAAGPLTMFGRLAPHASPRAAQGELSVVAAAAPVSADATAPLSHRVVRYTRSAMGANVEVLFASVVAALVLLLLVSAANVANLLLARTAARTREIAVRAALGASRARIAFQLFLEALAIAVVGAALGLAAARWGLAWFRRTVPDLPFWADLSLDPLVVGFATALTLVAATVAGVVPARGATGMAIGDALKEGGRGIRFGRINAVLVAAELAVAVGFLSGAATLGHGLMAFGYRGFGLPAERVLVAQLYHGQPPALEVADAPTERSARRAVWREFLAENQRTQRELATRLEATPGVRAVAFASHLPGNEPAPALVEVELGGAEPARRLTRLVEVGHGFFSMLDARLLRGRGFDLHELDGRGHVAIVNAPFARRMFGAADPLGRRVRLVTPGTGGAPDSAGAWLEIVGIAPDLGLNPGDPARADGIYVPLEPTNVVRIAIRTDADPRALVPVLHRQALALPAPPQVQWTKPLAAQLAEPVALFRGFGVGLTAVGGIALLLACAGLYAILALSVTQRRREIAVRLALGARPATVMRAVLRRSAGQIGVGVLVGGALGFAILEAIRSLPFDISRGGALTLAGTALLMCLAGAAACAVPVRRALAIRPMDLLREP